MVFPKVKKELLRYATINYADVHDGTTNQPPLQQHHLRPRRLRGELRDSRTLTMPTVSIHQDQQPQNLLHFCRAMNCSVASQESQQQNECRENGCMCENLCDDVYVDGCARQSTKNHSQWPVKPTITSTVAAAASNHSPFQAVPNTVSTTATTATATVNFATNMFLKCCGGGSSCMDSSTHTIPSSSNSTSSSSSRQKQTLPPKGQEYFNALMKVLRVNQKTSLLDAVRSRIEPSSSGANPHQDCIIITQNRILDQEPQVVTCQLFFWNNLKDASQLKRLPICLSKNNAVCCNPLHYCRIMDTDTAPPPYEGPAAKERLKVPIIGEISQNAENSYTASISTSISSTNNMQTEKYYRIPSTGSLTTDGEVRRSSSATWCQIAYWELTKRVGQLHQVKKPQINIFAENSCISLNDDCDDRMCLKDLFKANMEPSPKVLTTRKKIGYGVTLSQEADGVWVYNCSSTQIFVHSLTLSECFSCALKVMPGDCLLAFDIHRARALNPHQLPGMQIGPVDVFSMQISFAKGWGTNYSRPNINKCPCWLEIFFNAR